MEFISRYVSHQPDSNGFIDYSVEEHRVWTLLFERQSKLLPGRACDEFLEGLKSLQLTADKIPQLPDVNSRLKAATGWQVEAVPALTSKF